MILHAVAVTFGATLLSSSRKGMTICAQERIVKTSSEGQFPEICGRVPTLATLAVFVGGLSLQASTSGGRGGSFRVS
jgi:hypothetical protein